MNLGQYPFPGLRAFQRDEAYLFFGREGSVDSMIEQLARTHFLAVLGASGSGKSSMVRTGLLEALELGFFVKAGARWRIIDFHPGGQPLRNLAEQLSRDKHGSADVLDIEVMRAMIAEGPRSLIEWCRGGGVQTGQNLLLLVDQFEELFRYADYAAREEAEALVALLLESIRVADLPIFVVLTMRSEYIGACSLIPGLAEQINSGFYLTPRMSREECRWAIEGPASVAGFKVETTLVNQLLNDMASFAPWEEERGVKQGQVLSRRADQLPLMQHLLNRLWLTARGRRGEAGLNLTLDDYWEAGGLSGALDAHAAQVLGTLDGIEERDIQMLFRALVSGPDPTNAVRRPCKFSTLVNAVQNQDAVARRIVEAFRAPDCNFLQPPANFPLEEETVVDISHESLIRQWSKLSEWLRNEARADANWQRLQQSAERYRLGEGDLLMGLNLDSLALWWELETPTAEWAARHGGKFLEAEGYLRASREFRDASSLQEKARVRRERMILIGGVCLLAILLGIAIITGRTATLLSSQNLGRIKQLDESNRKLEESRRKEETLKQQALSREFAEYRAKKNAQDALAVAKKAVDHERKMAALVNLKMIEGLEKTKTTTEQIGSPSTNLERALRQATAYSTLQRMYPTLVLPSERARVKAVVASSLEEGGDVAASLAVRADLIRESVTAFHTRQLSLPEREALVRRILLDGSRYCWDSLDNGKVAEADKVQAEMESVAKLYGPDRKYASAPPSLYLPLADYERLLVRRAADAGTPDREKAHDAIAADLASRPGAPTQDVKSLLRLQAIILEEEKASPDAAANACRMREAAHEADKLDRGTLIALVKCKSELALAAQSAGKTHDADDLVSRATQLVDDALQKEPDAAMLLLEKCNVLNAAAQISRQRGDLKNEARQQRESGRFFVRALSGRTVSQQNTRQIRNLYDGFASLDFSLLPDHNSLKDQERFFWDVRDSLSVVRQNSPHSPAAAFVDGDATAKVATLLVKDDISQEAASEFQKAREAFLDGDSIGRSDLFTEDTAAVCKAWTSAIELAAKQGGLDEGLRLYKELSGSCMTALNKYPWDYYLREPITLAASVLGVALADGKRFAEALPLLEFSSAWGRSESSRSLSAIYRSGAAGKADEAQAKKYDERAGGQSLKRFTIPIDCGGVKTPFYVYVTQRADDIPFRGVDDQVKWIEKARSCTFPKDVGESFRKLDDIARENHVSFVDLVDYALGSGQKDEKKAVATPESKKLKEAEELETKGDWRGVARVAEEGLKATPNSTALLQTAEGAYHDHLFNYPRAYELNQIRLKLDEKNASAKSDFAEKNLTTGRYGTCWMLAREVRDKVQPATKKAMIAIEFACLTADGKEKEARAAGEALKAEIAVMEKAGWAFDGTENYVRYHKPFSSRVEAWASLFKSLQTGDRVVATAALAKLGIP